MIIPWWYYVISVLIALLCGWACGMLAMRKGYSGVVFGILGFFFFIITLIVILVLPDKTRA